jgi:hypothetical protein
MKEIEIKSLADLIEKISEFAKPHKRHLHMRLWFRGVPKANYELKPTVFRSPSHPHDLADDERHAFRDFRLWSAGMMPIGRTLEDLYSQQQHHGLPTRLLDWTTNALIAMYFAVEKDPTESAAVKKDIRDRLLHLGMDHFSVYGDVDSLATTVKSNFDLGTSN